MVGLKFWNAAQKPQPTTSDWKKEDDVVKADVQKKESNEDTRKEQTNEDTRQTKKGKSNELDPRLAKVIPPNSDKQMQEKPSAGGGKEQKKEDAPANSKSQDSADDNKEEPDKDTKYQQKNEKDVMKAVTSEKSEASANTPLDLQKPGRSTPPQIENPVATEEEKATQSPLEAQKPKMDEKTRRMIQEDEETIHGEMDELALGREASHKQEPVLSEDDEHFLQQVTTDIDAPPIPSKRATMIADDGKMTEEEIAEEASKVSLPATPREEKSEETAQGSASKPQTWKDRWSQWAIIPMPTSGVAFAAPKLLRGYNYKRQQSPEDKTKKAQAEKQQEVEEKKESRALAADDLKSAAAEVKAESEKPDSSNETKATADKNTQDVGSILSSLNLSAINNRVVGISGDTQKLLESFNTVLKDVINGGPRAYEDLEKLLTEREPQLDKLFGTLPPFLQSLVKSIPIKMYAALAPQLATAMAFERSGADASAFSTSSVDAAETSDVDEAQTAVDKKQKKKKKSLIPSLRSLIGEKGTVAAMLKSILSFLEMRFPALAFLTGANVLMSLSVFILLFVFYYCHKRGKETRLKHLIATEEDTTDTKTTDMQLYHTGPSLEDLESDAFFEKEDSEREARAAAAAAKAAETSEGEVKKTPSHQDGASESDRKVDELVKMAEEGATSS